MIKKLFAWETLGTKGGGVSPHDYIIDAKCHEIVMIVCLQKEPNNAVKP